MLLRVLLSLFFIAHGLVHVALWAPKYDPKKVPFDASRSWLLGEQRPLARVLAFAAAVILVVAGIALLAQGGWWRPTAVVGLGVSTVLMLVYLADSTGRRNTLTVRSCDGDTQTVSVGSGGSSTDAFTWSAAGGAA